MSRAVFCFALLLVATAYLEGCGGDSGTAPTISDLTYSPESGAVGQQATITGQIAFSDPDGDVESISIALVGPGNLSQTVGPQAVQGVTGLSSGTLGVAVIVNPPLAGTYTFDVWLTDAAGHDSNRLTGTFTAQ